MTTFPPHRIPYAHDPDDTAGRAYYRAYADTLARTQLAYEKRAVRLVATKGGVSEA